jgi:DnaJ-class molecular chaperone
MPTLGSPERKGDLYATVRPVMPKGVSDEQRELIERFRELRG